MVKQRLGFPSFLPIVTVTSEPLQRQKDSAQFKRRERRGGTNQFDPVSADSRPIRAPSSVSQERGTALRFETFIESDLSDLSSSTSYDRLTFLASPVPTMVQYGVQKKDAQQQAKIGGARDQCLHFVDLMIAFASVGGPDGGWMVVDGEWMWW
ncbi:hypothetical protein NEUTE2DRAFT_129648 [Neurospora tetrasperma FGSC 2509]|nr:hypothetical protein NEUTE2DRAFT_129648 [Neurospora tetrasperma FGSC 2509]